MDTASPVRTRPHREFFRIDPASGWARVDASAGTIEEHVLVDSFDPVRRRGSRTRLVRWSAGARLERPVIHDHCEDVFVVEGDFVVGCDANGAGGESFGPYTFATRPPGVWHGPFATRGGCVLLETQYFD
jgi:hypothetical protein